MTLLARVVRTFDDAKIPFALIGAAALAAHGVSRSTADIDLLTTDRRALDAQLWAPLHVTVDIREGDADDPLAGVVRLSEPGERDIDIVVGRSAWQPALIARAQRVDIADTNVAVVDAAGLMLLKLYAGGSQDAWDIEQLLGAGDRAELTAAVDAEIVHLPQPARDLWTRVCGR